MKTPKLLALCALGAGLLTVATTTPSFAYKGTAHATKAAKTDALGLTAAQRAQLKPIESASKAQIKAIKADKTLSKKERKSRMKAIKADRDAKVNAILTPTQRQKLADMREQKQANNKAAKTPKV